MSDGGMGPAGLGSRKRGTDNVDMTGERPEEKLSLR